MLDLDDPVAVLLAAVEAFRARGIECAVYGGLALAAYGEPRETKDADLAVVGTRGADAEAALSAAGFDASLAFESVPFGGNIVSRVTLLGPGAAPGINTVDVVEPRSPRYARDSLSRAVSSTLRGIALRVLSPEDFVLYKVLSTRDRDLEDAASVIRSLGERLDLTWVRSEAETLAREIPEHDVEKRMGAALAMSSA